MRIQPSHIVIAAVWGVGLPAWSVEGDGLQATDSSWFGGRWQARFELGLGAGRLHRVDPYNLAADSPRRPRRGLAVLGDYYFDVSDPHHPVPAAARGLRATGGLVVAPRSAAASPSSRRGVTAGAAQGLAGHAIIGGWAHPYNDVIAVPYLGVGYTDLPSRSGWGFRADFGLMALRPQSAVQFGSALSGAQGIDDLLREMRLSPLIQFGVSYAF